MNRHYVDLFLLHNQIIADGDAAKYRGTPHSLFVDTVRPIFEQMVQNPYKMQRKLPC